MMFAYELQDRLKGTGKDVSIYVCHPGASATSLISSSGGLMTRLTWRLRSKTPMVQTAEKGSYPEVMCATEDGREQRALYGPIGLMQTGGPVGKGTRNPHAYDKAVMEKLWQVPEEATDFDWVI